jgi:transposase
MLRIYLYMRGYEWKITILMSVPGIGFLLSSKILAEIRDINDYPSSDKLA